MADESYWMWKASTPTPSHQEAVELGCFNGTEAGWHTLTPGMRREIVRLPRAKKIADERAAYAAQVLNTFDDFEHADKREFLDRKAEVERAGRERI